MSIVGELSTLFRDSNISDFAWNGSDRLCAVATGSKLITIDLENRKRLPDIDLSFSCHAIAFTSATELACASLTTTAPRHVDLDTSTVTALSAAANCRTSFKHQTMAGQLADGKALAGSSSSGTLVTITNTGPASGTLTPAEISGTTVNAVIAKPGSSLWLIGTTNGKVHEISFTGTVSKTITLPTTPNTGSGTTQSVTTLCLIDDSLFVGTASGIMYEYTYSSSTLKRIFSVASATTTPKGVQFSSPVNGLFFMHNTDDGGLPQAISIMDGGTLPLTPLEQLQWFGTDRLIGCFFDDVNNFACVVSEIFIYAFGCTGLTPTTIATRAQEPVGSDIAHRLLRMHRNGLGQWKLTSDANQLDEEENVDARLNDQIYVDLSLIGTQFTDEEFDVRSAQA